MATAETYVRIQFDLPKSSVDELDKMAKAANIRTRKEFFNNALTFFECMILQRQHGKRIFIADIEGRSEKEFEMPVFSQIERVVSLKK
jgi:hypothetical protein